MASLNRRRDSRGVFWEVRWRGPGGEHKKRRRNKAAADQGYAWAVTEEAKRRDPLAYRAASDVSLGFVLDQWWEAHVEGWQGNTRALREGIIKNHIPSDWKSHPARHIRPGELQATSGLSPRIMGLPWLPKSGRC